MILHLVPKSYFVSIDSASEYLPETYAADGFIHCTEGEELLLKVANAFYRDVPGEFLVLVIDPARVQSEVRFEPPDPSRPPGEGETLFPHIYGPLNRDAIVEIRRAHRAADGTFLDL